MVVDVRELVVVVTLNSTYCFKSFALLESQTQSIGFIDHPRLFGEV